LPASVIALVLLAALLHATWNAVVKSSEDKFLDVVLVTLGAAAISGPAIIFMGLPSPASWPYIGASVTIHIGYFVLLGAAYRSGDMSHVYPLMRGAPPLLVACASGPLIGEHLSVVGWSGVLLISGGILGLIFIRDRHRGILAGATALALANAVVIAAYTSVDGVGARVSGNAPGYTMCIFLLGAPPIAGWVLLRRPARVLEHFHRRWHFALIGGACGVAAYTLALWAMTRAPIALVAALRETAILFGTALSVLFLRERIGMSQYAATAVIMLGAVVLRLA
jgi:drug/metabolite transporter (DMT)-like permease